MPVERDRTKKSWFNETAGTAVTGSRPYCGKRSLSLEVRPMSGWQRSPWLFGALAGVIALAAGMLWRQLAVDSTSPTDGAASSARSSGADAAGHGGPAADRSASGRARSWSSISGRPGACRAGRRCPSSSSCSDEFGAQGPAVRRHRRRSAGKGQRVRQGARPQLSGADRRLRRHRALRRRSGIVSERCPLRSSSTAPGRCRFIPSWGRSSTLNCGPSIRQLL